MCNSTNYKEDHWSHTKFARKCDNCGKGMNQGYCWGDGDGYACSDKCLFVDGYTPEQRDEDYKNEFIYWTEWHEDEESIADEYYTKEGELVEN